MLQHPVLQTLGSVTTLSLKGCGEGAWSESAADGAEAGSRAAVSPGLLHIDRAWKRLLQCLSSLPPFSSGAPHAPHTIWKPEDKGVLPDLPYSSASWTQSWGAWEAKRGSAGRTKWKRASMPCVHQKQQNKTYTEETKYVRKNKRVYTSVWKLRICILIHLMCECLARVCCLHHPPGPRRYPTLHH